MSGLEIFSPFSEREFKQISIDGVTPPATFDGTDDEQLQWKPGM